MTVIVTFLSGKMLLFVIAFSVLTREWLKNKHHENEQKRRVSVGQVAVGTTVKVVDEQLREQPVHTSGEILVKGGTKGISAIPLLMLKHWSMVGCVQGI